MKALGKTTIESFEEPDHLLFVVTHTGGWLIIACACIALATAVFFLWPNHKLFTVLLLAFSLFGWLTSLAQGNITRLVVSEHEISAHGNLSRNFTTDITVPASQVKSIEYGTGGENDPVGLYVYRIGHNYACLLPGLDREEAEAIILRIRQRFPDLEQGDTSPDSLLFSEGGGITRLNLS